MKKIVRIIKRNLFGFVVGILLTSTLGVSAAVIYTASQIKYTPIANGQIANVEEALNDLYENYSCVNGSVNHPANTQWNIELGFIPSKVFLSFVHSGADCYVSYDKSLSDTILLSGIENNGTMNLGVYNQLISITSKITSNFTPEYRTYSSQYTLNYVACK